MTLYEFNALTFEEKLTLVFDIGVFLDNYVSVKERINCYAIDKFFVEVYYDSKKNAIVDIQSFKCGDSLNKYSTKFKL